MRAHWTYPALCLPCVLAVAGLLGACATETAVERQVPPTTVVTTLAVGALDAGTPEAERLARRFRRQLVASLEDSQAFPRVVSPAPRRLPEGAVRVSGRFTDVTDGSDAWGYLVGWGAGAPSLDARFEIRDASGTVLASFETGTAFGLFWEGVELDAVADELAALAADTIVRWSRGEPL